MNAASIHVLFECAAVLVPGVYLPVAVGRLLRTHRLLDPLYVRIGWAMSPFFVLVETATLIECYRFAVHGRSIGIVDGAAAAFAFLAMLFGLGLALVGTVELATRTTPADSIDLAIALDARTI